MTGLTAVARALAQSFSRVMPLYQLPVIIRAVRENRSRRGR